MKSYVTLGEAKRFKEVLKGQYNTIFHVEKLNEEEKAALGLYNITKMSDFTTDSLGVDTIVLAETAKRKMFGEDLNEYKKESALDAYAAAYTQHKNHIKPSFFHPFQRYAYWKESKAVEEFADMLVKKGIARETLDNLKTAIQDEKQYIIRSGEITQNGKKINTYVATDDEEVYDNSNQDSYGKAYTKEELEDFTFEDDYLEDDEPVADMA